MKRRGFLGLAAFLAAVAGLCPDLLAVAGRAGAAGGRPLDRLLQACPRRGHAAAVGRAYLQSLRSAVTPDQLAADLTVRLAGTPWRLACLGPDEVRARLKHRAAEDFRTGRSVLVQGWVLAETEARLCAIAALCRG